MTATVHAIIFGAIYVIAALAASFAAAFAIIAVLLHGASKALNIAKR